MKLIKVIFDWWHQATWSTRIFTFWKGELVGIDNYKNKYFHERGKKEKGYAHWDRRKRWVIYSGEIEATKIPIEWYSWMHFIKNKIEGTHELKKYNWQKNHLSNQTGTDKAYNPQKNQDATKKKYKTWNN